MKFVNKYLRNLAPYKVASHKVWEVSKTERKQILKLDWNEATVCPSPKVKQALRALVEEEETYYLYPSTNNMEILNSLADYTQSSVDNVQYFASSDALHEYLVRMYVGVGDPILILGPTYDNFRLTCESQGGQVFIFEYEKDFSFDSVSFEKKIEEVSPSLIYICNPNNPSGNLVDSEFIISLLEKYTDTIVLVDEAYFEFSKSTMASYINKYNNLFVTRTFSKAFALANFRAGYLISHPENIKQISKIRNPKNFTTFTQVAISAALKDVEYMQKYVEEVLRAKAIFADNLKSLPYVKNVFESHGNFLLVEFETFEIKTKVFDLLSENLIFVRNLTHSALLTNCLRITIGTKEQMERVFQVFKNF